MQHLMQFGIGIKTLSDTEFIGLIKSYDRTYLSNLLFNSFRFDLEDKNNTKQCQKVNHHIAQIIRNRKKKIQQNQLPSQQIIQQTPTPQPISLDFLPNEMLSNISSFLNFDDNKHLELTNKSIFIGTRSPASLQTIDPVYLAKSVKWIARYNKTYIFNKFQSLKQIIFQTYGLLDDLDQMETISTVFPCFNVINWENIELLTFECRQDDDCFFHAESILLQMVDHNVNLSNLKEIWFFNLKEIDMILMNSTDFMMEISGLSNINSWEINSTSIHGSIRNLNDINHYKSYEILKQFTMSEMDNLSGDKHENIKQINLSLVKSESDNRKMFRILVEKFPLLECISIANASLGDFDMYYVWAWCLNGIKIQINNQYIINECDT